mgnify:CR=1 FL=1
MIKIRLQYGALYLRELFKKNLNVKNNISISISSFICKIFISLFISAKHLHFQFVEFAIVVIATAALRCLLLAARCTPRLGCPEPDASR